MTETLAGRLIETALEHAPRPAVHAAARTLTYEELFRGACEVARALAAAGIGPGQRVAIWMEKSIDSLRVLLGSLLAGAVYVPIDPKAPALRALAIASDAEVSALALDPLRRAHGEALRSELPSLRLLLFQGEAPLADDGATRGEAFASLARGLPLVPTDPQDPAYILYTSGSTGKPKGVVLSHRAALSFVDWCLETFEPSPDDRMSSHAPFHFDLSTFDLFATFSAGASVRLLSSTEAMLAPWLVRQLAGWGLTFWYSVPSALVAMLEQGGLRAELWPTARVILFAGEVFPTPPLRRLRRALPGPRLVNLYGPTETNVCTWYEVEDLPDEQTAPIPIGRVCENLHGAVLDDALHEVQKGTEGDLWIGGGNLLTAYWNDPDLTARRLRPDPRPGREGLLYHTGDRVREGDDGNLVFLGRRDHMVKVRGYRVELGEVESVLHGHGGVAEAAVVAVADPETGHRLEAWVVARPALALDEAGLRVFLKDRLPLYMLPARIRTLDALPRTSTGKIDRVTLTERAAGEA